MSLMGMRESLNKFSKPIMIGMGVIMLGGAVFNGLGRNSPVSAGRESQAAREEEAPVAKIGSQNVTMRMVEERLDQQLRMYKMYGLPQPPPEALENYRLQALDSIKSDIALAAVAQREGVKPTDDELKRATDEVWATALRPQLAAKLKLDAKVDDAAFQAALEKEQPGATIERLKEAYINPEAVRQKLYSDGLKKALRAKMNLNEETVKQTLSRYKVRHILINFGGTSKLTEADAKKKAEGLLAEVKADPKKMPELATKNSDDPGSKDKGGLYEWKKEELGSLVPEFKAAVDKLKPGETYPEVVKHTGGYSGFHIIRLEEIGAPADFAKEKQKYLDQYAEGELNKKLDEVVKAEEPKITVTLLDPSLTAAQLLRDAQSTVPAGGAKGAAPKPDEKKLEAALAELNKVKKESDRLGTLPLRRAMILQLLKRDAEALVALEEALKTNGNKPETRMKLALGYIATGDKTKASAQLAEAEKLAIPDPQTWVTIAGMYTQLGDAAGNRRALEKNQELTRRRQEMEAQQAAQQKAAAAAAAPKPEAPAAAPSPAAPAPK